MDAGAVAAGGRSAQRGTAPLQPVCPGRQTVDQRRPAAEYADFQRRPAQRLGQRGLSPRRARGAGRAAPHPGLRLQQFEPGRPGAGSGRLADRDPGELSRRRLAAGRRQLHRPQRCGEQILPRAQRPECDHPQTGRRLAHRAGALCQTRMGGRWHVERLWAVGGHDHRRRALRVWRCGRHALQLFAGERNGADAGADRCDEQHLSPGETLVSAPRRRPERQHDGVSLLGRTRLGERLRQRQLGGQQPPLVHPRAQPDRDSVEPQRCGRGGRV